VVGPLISPFCAKAAAVATNGPGIGAIAGAGVGH